MVQLESRGVPTVVLTTTEFQDLTKESARSNELPEARVLVTHHPLGATSAEAVTKWADEAVPELERLFTT